MWKKNYHTTHRFINEKETSVSFGRAQFHGEKPRKVQLGFTKGYLLSDDGHLEKGTRKQIFWKTFYSVKEIDIEKISALLYEAVLLDH